MVFDFRFPIYLISAPSTQLTVAKEKIGLPIYEEELYEDAALKKTAVVGRAVEVEDSRCLSVKV